MVDGKVTTPIWEDTGRIRKVSRLLEAYDNWAKFLVRRVPCPRCGRFYPECDCDNGQHDGWPFEETPADWLSERERSTEVYRKITELCMDDGTVLVGYGRYEGNWFIFLPFDSEDEVWYPLSRVRHVVWAKN